MTGVAGETAAVHSGILDVEGSARLGAMVVTADTALEAVNQAVTGSINVALGGQTAAYAFTDDTVGNLDMQRPFTLRQVGSVVTVGLEDMATWVNADWDRTDRTWEFLVTEDTSFVPPSDPSLTGTTSFAWKQVYMGPTGPMEEYNFQTYYNDSAYPLWELIQSTPEYAAAHVRDYVPALGSYPYSGDLTTMDHPVSVTYSLSAGTFMKVEVEFEATMTYMTSFTLSGTREKIEYELTKYHVIHPEVEGDVVVSAATSEAIITLDDDGMVVAVGDSPVVLSFPVPGPPNPISDVYIRRDSFIAAFRSTPLPAPPPPPIVENGGGFLPAID